MADEDQDQEQQPSTPTADPSTQAEPSLDDLLARPDIEAAIKSRVEAVIEKKIPQIKRSVRRELQQQIDRAPTSEQSTDSQAAETPPEPTKGPTRRSKVSELEQRLEFRDAVAEYGFDRNQRKRFESLFIAEGGDDPDEWLSDFVQTAGLGKNKQGAQPSPPPTTQAVTPAPAPPAPTGPSESDRGGPSAANNTFAVDSPERWTEEHVNRLKAEALESKQDPGRYVRNKFLAGLRGKTIVFSR